MNILVFSWRDPKHPFAGGAEQVMHEHMKGWAAAGHKVVLFSSRIKDYKPREEILDGITIRRHGCQMLGVQIAAFFWYLFGSHPKFDLVVDQFHGIPFFTPFYVRTKKLAVLQEVAREVWFLNHLPNPLNLIVGTLGYCLEPFIFLFYRYIPFMVGSESAQKSLVELGIPKKNITIVPHGVVLNLPSPLPSKNKTKTIIFLGALSKDKGIEDALKAFSFLKKKGKYNFWVVGKGGISYMENLEKLVKNLKLWGKVKFWGFVDEKRKFELLRRAHVLVNPSIREGWGLVNIEANAVGTPVVAYKSPGLIDSVKDGVSGVICKSNSPEEITKEVIDLLSDADKYKRLSAGAISWSKKFSWAKSKKQSLMLCESVY